jgi:hypothetical protein
VPQLLGMASLVLAARGVQDTWDADDALERGGMSGTESQEAALREAMRALVAESSTYQVPLDYTVLAPMITISAFIMGIVLSNVMSDYKESEKIPAEMTGYFVTIMSFSRTEAKRYGKSAVPLLKEVEAMLLAVMARGIPRPRDVPPASRVDDA